MIRTVMREPQGLWEPQRRHLIQTGGQRGLPSGEEQAREEEAWTQAVETEGMNRFERYSRVTQNSVSAGDLSKFLILKNQPT